MQKIQKYKLYLGLIVTTNPAQFLAKSEQPRKKV